MQVGGHPPGERLAGPNDEDQLGGPVGPEMRTADIRGHGGVYRIGYRWLLMA